MNAEVERYLRRATRGLWGKRRLEVREELAAHLEGRVTAHRIAGLSEQGAVEKVLAELGSPGLVNVGMVRLYTLPTVATSGAVLGAVCVALAALLPKVLAQPEVRASFYWPTEACVKAQQMDALYGACEEFDSLWLEPQSFKAEMRHQGVVIDEGESLTLRFPNGAFVRLPTEPHELMTGETTVRTEPGVVAFTGVFRELLDQPGTVWFENWDNPVVHVGGVAFQVGTTKHRVPGEKFYKDVLGAIFFAEFSEPLVKAETTTYYLIDPRLELSRTAPATTIEIEKPGVYGVMTSLRRDLFRAPWLPSSKPGDVLTAFEIVRPDEAGTLVARLPKDVTFATSFSSAHGTNTAVLVRFADGASAGVAGYTVVSPEHITLTARD